MNGWDQYGGGNFWSRYNVSDPDGVGIGNLEYWLDGGYGQVDRYPLMSYPTLPNYPDFASFMIDGNVDQISYFVPIFVSHSANLVIGHVRPSQVQKKF